MQEEHPLRIVMSRRGSDSNHDNLREATGVILKEPHVGEGLQVYFDDGKWLRTTPIKHVARQGTELVVETANSTYSLKIRGAA